MFKHAPARARRRAAPTITALLAVLVGVACGDGPTAPEAADPSVGGALDARLSGGGRAGSGTVTVVSQNLYVGADIVSLLSAAPEDVPFAVADLYGQILASDFSARVAAMAAEMAGEAPDLIGLQEVSLFRTQTPGDVLAGNPIAAVETALDFLPIFLDALRAQGLEYRAVSVSPNLDVEVPMFDPGSPTLISDIRLTDFDVVLAHLGVRTENPVSANYAVNLSADLAGAPIVFLRGFSAVDATVNGRRIRFINTHLEPADPLPGTFIPDFQIAQISELLAGHADTRLPTVLVGDFSSDPTGDPSSASRLTRDAGFVDVWKIGRRRGDGVTCCQAPDLANEVSQLDRRVDIIWYRDGFTRRRGRFRGSARARVIGAGQADRTATGLWPADHAGVLATIRPVGRGDR